MGAWSVEPFGNDLAGDWAWELDSVDDWSPVRDALQSLLDSERSDEGVETIAIAAAEVVAHGLGAPTQDDAYTESVDDFVQRAGFPPTELVPIARAALAKATAPTAALAALWDGDKGWANANAEIALRLVR